MELDMQGINEYFKDFKIAESLSDDSPPMRESTLPPIDAIIAESFKVKINREWMEELKEEFKRT